MPVGRNDPCPCGSGRKYKRCHGLPRGAAVASTALHAESRAAQVLFDDAQRHREAGDWALAESLYRRCIRLQPDHVDALTALGVLLDELGRLDEAEATFRALLSAPAPPASGYCNLGAVLLRQGRAAEAVTALQRAVSMQPRYAIAQANLGAALTADERFDEAELAVRAALAIDDRQPSAHCNLGTLLMRRHDDAAMGCFERALQLDPQFIDGHVHRAALLRDQGLIADATLAWRRAITLAPDLLPLWNNLLLTLLYDDRTSAVDLLAWHRRFDTVLAMTSGNEVPAATARRPAPPHRARLRIGFLSPDLRQHPVGSFVEPLFEHHDRSQIELVGYHDSVIDDAVSHRLSAHAAAWVRTADLDDARLAARIAEDRLDVLIELAGHTGLRLRMLSRRPAPVQVTWIGYPGTTGLSAIDVRLTDARADPPGHEALHAERLLRLPNSYYCFRPPQNAPQPGPLPALQRDGVVTFGSFNNVSKISASTLRLWADVLRAVPRSRLLLKAAALAYPTVRQRLLGALGELGVEAGRVTFREWQAQGHLGAYADVDVALDTRPFNGATTTCEALWMGVPVVTLGGDRPQARMGLSILSAAGCSDWVASDDAGLVASCQRLAGDLGALQVIRSELRGRLATTPLLDGRRFAADFEQAMRGLCAASSINDRGPG